MRADLPALVLLSCLGVACGGTDEGRFAYEAMDTSEVDPCRGDQGFELLSVIDFEPYEVSGASLSTNVQCNPELGSACEFYFNYDYRSSPPNTPRGYPRGEDCVELAVAEDAEVTTLPRIGQATFQSQEIPDGRCGNAGHGLNIMTENVGMCYGTDGRLGWGAALDVTFAPLDASDWDGIGLWIKRTPGSEKLAFILQFVDPNTAGADDPETGDSALCDASDPSTAPDSQKCDSFGAAITLTDEWSFLAVRFDDLAQKGFGVVSPLGHLKLDEIIRMQIFMNAGNADFWLDDISLFREVP